MTTELQVVPVTVCKHSYAVATALVAFGLAVSEALKDGWQIGQDTPAILKAASNDLLPLMKELVSLPSDLRSSPEDFVMGLVLGAAPLIHIGKADPTPTV